MKWVGRILYLILLYIIGIFVLSFAQQSATYKFYQNEGIPFLKDDNREEYIARYFTIFEIEKYLKDPIYIAKSENDEKFNFEFAIYQFKYIENEKELTYLAFYFNEISFDYKELLNDYESYEKNNNLAAIRIELKFAGIEELGSDYFEIDINDRMPSIIVQQTLNNNNEDIFQFKYKNAEDEVSTKESNEFESIKLYIQDYSGIKEKEDEAVTTLFAEFNSDSLNEMDQVDQLVSVEGVLTSTNFNGSISKFSLEEKYSNPDNLGNIYLDILRDYQKSVVPTMIIYVLIALVVTFLIFFLRPVMDIIKDKKFEKERVSKEIFAEENINNNNDNIIDVKEDSIEIESNNDILVEDSEYSEEDK